jgi:hypothetical protein
MRRMFRLSEADEAFLEALGSHRRRSGRGARWLLLQEFPVGAGYTVDKTTVLVRIA